MSDTIFSDIYKGKRVFITGHTGFKGSWLTLILKKLGAEVMGYSLKPNTNPNLFTICGLDKEIANVFGDIRDEKKLTDIVSSFKPDIIFHLAAQPLVRYSYSNPKETYETNVIGTLNVYEAARRSKSVKAIVSITTDKCYENNEDVYGYRENDPMGGYDPYSSSKGCMEILSASYRRSFFESEGILLSTVRAGNVIGGGDWAEDRIIPDFVRAISKDKSLEIRNPLAVRPWQHVLEPLSGYLLIGMKLLSGDKEYASAWNFGPNDFESLNVSQVLDRCIEFYGKGTYKLADGIHPHEAMSLRLDISKARVKLRWSPAYSAEESIKYTMEWYKKYYESSIDMKEFTLNQITEYFRKVNY